MKQCKVTLIVCLTLAVVLLTPPLTTSRYGVIKEAQAVSRTIVLQGTFPTWNGSNPTITVTQSDSITMQLSNPDGATHRFVVSVDNGAPTNTPNCTIEKCSPTFNTPIAYPFNVDFSAGSYKYYCSIHFTSMVGTFQVNVLHDAATTKLSVSRNFGYAGVPAASPIKINVTVANLGSGTEASATVVTKANSTVIGTQTITNIPASSITIVTFSWNVTSITVGRYTVSGNVSLTGDANPSNNALTFPTLFQVRKTGDVDGNGIVNLDDMLTVAVAWGFTYNPNADILNLGIITLDDVLLVATNWH